LYLKCDEIDTLTTGLFKSCSESVSDNTAYQGIGEALLGYSGLVIGFFGVPHLATCIFLFFYNEPELGVGIDPGMALTPLPSCIGQVLKPRPSDREPSALPLDHSFCFQLPQITTHIKKWSKVTLKIHLYTCKVITLGQ